MCFFREDKGERPSQGSLMPGLPLHRQEASPVRDQWGSEPRGRASWQEQVSLPGEDGPEEGHWPPGRAPAQPSHGWSPTWIPAEVPVPLAKTM